MLSEIFIMDLWEHYRWICSVPELSAIDGYVVIHSGSLEIPKYLNTNYQSKDGPPILRNFTPHPMDGHIWSPGWWPTNPRIITHYYQVMTQCLVLPWKG